MSNGLQVDLYTADSHSRGASGAEPRVDGADTPPFKDIQGEQEAAFRVL